MSQDIPRYEAGPVGQLTGYVISAQKAGEWHNYSYPLFSGTPHEPGYATWKHPRRCIDGLADRLTIPVDALQLGAKQLAGFRVNILDF
jgi:hypothetical protein